MKKKLARNLGIFALLAIACGAMVSGLLVLPGHAAKLTGPSVFWAFLLAGVLFLPATFSKCEMATAVPESGGDYLFIDRSLGPLFSTITGLGMFLTMMLKSAFALAGLGAYLAIMVPLPENGAIYAGIGVAGIVVMINFLGAKKSGTFQQVLFVITVIALLLFVGEGSIGVDKNNLRPALTKGWSGLITATAFVFVSYAGVTKIASVAEEVKNPGRMIPVGMFVSLGIMVFLYVIVVYVMMGNVSYEMFLEEKTFANAPLALAGREVAGPWAMYVLAGVSVLALTAMANAGVLASSRYPFALSRYGQLPPVLQKVHPTFSTPSNSILLTGTLLVLSIYFLPVIKLAKLASAFKLIVLGLLNFALIILRESDIEWYQPEFKSPLYPYLQIFGVLTSVVLIGFLGVESILASSGLILLGIVWYFAYVRYRVDREGAIFKSIRVDDTELELFDDARTQRGTDRRESVIVPFFNLNELETLHIERRIRLGAALTAENERLDVVNFVEIPEQSLLSEYEGDREQVEMLNKRVRLLENEVNNEIEVDEVITHNSRAALTSYAEEEQPHWVVFDWKEPSSWGVLIGMEEWWLEDFPTDALFFDDRGNQTFKNILVITDPGPYDGEVVYAADHVAGHENGHATFLNPVPDDQEKKNHLKEFQEEMLNMCSVSSNGELIDAEEWVSTVVERTGDVDLLIIGGLLEEPFPGFDGQEMGRIITEHAECSVARIKSSLRSPRSVFSREEQFNVTKKTEKALHEHLQLGDICTDWDVDGKGDLFKEIARHLTGERREQKEIESNLNERERIQSTYIGKGIALPHAIVESMEETKLLISVLPEPVPYSDDGEDQVRICLAIIGPASDRQEHLELISNVSDWLMQVEVREFLLSGASSEEIYRKVREHQDK